MNAAAVGGRKLELGLTVILCAAAVSAAAALVHREFAPGERQATATSRGATVKPSGFWADALGRSIISGPENPPVTIVEFGDLECPFCARFHQTVRILQDTHPGQVGLRFVHFPLGMHRFAKPAAVAVECADDRSHRMLDVLFAKQDSLGLKTWAAYAVAAGVVDTVRFRTCMARNDEPKRVRDGLELGKRAGVHATPTVLVNGWRYDTPPSLAELERVILAVKSGVAPFTPAGGPPEP